MDAREAAEGTHQATQAATASPAENGAGEQNRLPPDPTPSPPDGPNVEHASQEFIGRWNRLVSTTNWEKGRIIQQWREALIDVGAAAQEYSDETWSRRVGGVTGQHAGRLRRVYQRFGASYGKFPGLYWSHFQAAVDWDDAEMWLEGAVHSQWSVNAMRNQRWETLGQTAEDSPVIESEVDEDFEPAMNAAPDDAVRPQLAEIRGGDDDDETSPPAHPGSTGRGSRI